MYTLKSLKQLLKLYMDIYNNVCNKFSSLTHILSGNGIEFKNFLFANVAKQLADEYKVYLPLYHPQSNSRTESFYHFLKACISRHVSKTLEWDQVILLACAAYNYLPNEHSKESPFFLIFACNPVLILNTLL